IRHLEKAFENVTPLKDVNAEINKGDIISVIGPSGTGKSTLLRCINMLDPPTSGQVFVNDIELTNKHTDIFEMRHKIGMVFQSFNLFTHKMVIENIMMAPMDLLKVSKKEAFDEGVRLLKLVGLGEKIYAYPDELSGGQKQRVAIARCLAMKPEIILFDEPTSALDPTMIGEVQSVIHDLAEQGLTMMVVTHDMKFSKEIANRIFYMDEGVIFEEGSPDEIFDNPKKEKTRAFVKHLRTWNYVISSSDFDFYEMNSDIDEFGRKQYLSQKQITNIELIIEELVMNHIINYTTDISIEVGYFEVDDKIQISFSYGGEQFDPFNTEKEDILSMLLVHQLTKNIQYEYGEKNTLIVEINL
ncbi:MAG: amino acid ABC transporter ATP-binding protein, partial [Oscillospiraceae bacterium]